MKDLSGWTKTAFLCFFASHIPITLIMGGQAVFPQSLYPIPIRQMLDWYAATFNDSLMTRPFDPWIACLFGCEVFLQLPFFVAAVYSLSSQRVSGRGWFRSACLIYSAHTVTTQVPVLVHVLSDSGTSVFEKATLLGFYLPYLVFPLWLMIIAIVSKDVFHHEEDESDPHTKQS